MPSIKVIIPAFNEEQSISQVIRAIPPGLVDEVIVANNGSTDKTAFHAEQLGATVIHESRPGYGRACLAGLAYLTEMEKTKQPDIVVFLDGDYSDYPEQMADLISPILREGADLVIGSRSLGKKESGSMTMPQVFGNWLATRLMKVFYDVQFTDLGPFRAIRYQALCELIMVDTNYGWTVEMQIKAAKKGLNCTEVAVNYRKRIGTSKISGTIIGTVSAGYKILYTLFKYR